MAFIVIAVAAVLAIADQLLKLLVVNTIKSGGSVDILGGFVKFIYVENKGVAFGMMENFQWLFILVTGIIMVALIVYLFKYKPTSKLLQVSFALIIGGGIGNLIDRIMQGYVVDYIQLAIFPPVCNFADYCVTIGTALLVIYVIFFSDFLKNDNKKEIGQ